MNEINNEKLNQDRSYKTPFQKAELFGSILEKILELLTKQTQGNQNDLISFLDDAIIRDYVRKLRTIYE